MIRALRAALASAARRRLGVPTMGSSLDRLRHALPGLGRACDIGAYRGDFTQELLARWPGLEVTCLEPLDARRDELARRFAGRSRVHVRGELLGATSGREVDFATLETASSVLREHVDQTMPRVRRTTAALDDLVAAGAVPGPLELIKVDVQGYELEVLRGAERCLASAQVLILELNLLDIHVGVPLIHEVSQHLALRSFVMHDIAGLMRRPLDAALWQVDAVFVRTDSPLRADKRWGA